MWKNSKIQNDTTQNVTKLKYPKFDRTLILKIWREKKIKLKNWPNCEVKIWPNLKTQNVTKHKNSKSWQNSKTQNVTKLKNSKCDKTQIVTKLKNPNFDKT